MHRPVLQLCFTGGMSGLKLRETSIPGLLEIDLELFDDQRGWFKENYQEEKLRALGFPEFKPVQNNFSYNRDIGVTRGIHAEPWDKYISLANGRVFVAIVDLRDNATYGTIETFELTPSKAIFVPHGCGNSFQTLESDVVYAYLTNAHWHPGAEYKHVNLWDETLAIEWPISKDKAITSDKDKLHAPFQQKP